MPVWKKKKQNTIKEGLEFRKIEAALYIRVDWEIIMFNSISSSDPITSKIIPFENVNVSLFKSIFFHNP